MIGNHCRWTSVGVLVGGATPRPRVERVVVDLPVAVVVRLVAQLDATTALPGAADCRVNVGGSMTPSDPYYQCTIARNLPPAEVGPAFDKAVSAVQATLGSGWLQWMDPETAPYDRHFRRFAKRTTRGFEETAVITVGLSETGVTISVSKVGLSS